MHSTAVLYGNDTYTECLNTRNTMIMIFQERFWSHSWDQLQHLHDRSSVSSSGNIVYVVVSENDLNLIY